VQQSNERTEIEEKSLKFDHCYMNLPVDAVEFLDAFIGLFVDANPKIWWENESDPKSLMLPMIHVNGFTYEKDRESALKFFTERIGKAMKFSEFSEVGEIKCFHNIRDVSSTSHMYCTSFRLPYEVAMAGFEKTEIYKKFEDTNYKK
jgi:hypothetical protein